MSILAQDRILCRVAALPLVTALIHKPVGGQSHSLRGLYSQVLDAFCYLTLEGRGAASALGRAYLMDCELVFVLLIISVPLPRLCSHSRSVGFSRLPTSLSAYLIM